MKYRYVKFENIFSTTTNNFLISMREMPLSNYSNPRPNTVSS